MKSGLQPHTLTTKLIALIETEISSSPSIPIIGLSGPQGSGKSTALKYVLEHSRYNIAGLGLDDFYLTKSSRKNLSEEISPLFETRGPAGTHDLTLLERSLNDLITAHSGSQCLLPKFDKPSDDRLPRKAWQVFSGRPDAIIIEGWMIGATLPPDFMTSAPINEIERQDTDKAWRRAQSDQLLGPYSDLWNRVDYFLHIFGPGFETVKDWRLEQEASNLNIKASDLPNIRRQWVFSFVQYFERITKSMHGGYVRPGIFLKIDENREYIT